MRPKTSDEVSLAFLKLSERGQYEFLKNLFCEFESNKKKLAIKFFRRSKISDDHIIKIIKSNYSYNDGYYDYGSDDFSRQKRSFIRLFAKSSRMRPSLVVKVSRLGERYDDCKKIIIKNYKGSENSLINFRIRELKTQIKELQKTKTKKHGSI